MSKGIAFVSEFIITVVVIVFLSSPPAAAMDVTFDFVARIDPTGQLHDGQLISGSFTWDTSATGQILNLGALGSQSLYSGAIVAAQFDGWTFNPQSSTNNLVAVFENETGTTGYRIQLSDGSADLDFRLYSSNPSVVSSYALPSILPSISDFDSTLVAFLPNGSSTDDFGGIIAIQPSVPEVSTWIMMLVGFAGIGFMAYRRNSRPALQPTLMAA